MYAPRGLKYKRKGLAYRKMGMGFIDTLLGAAGALTGGGGTPGGGMSPVGASQPSGPTATTISPTFQQDFSAQVSPTISPIIGSPGATGGVSTPVFAAPGGQHAAGGGTTIPPAQPMSTPSYMPSPSVAPLSLPSLANPNMQQRFNIQDYVPRGFSPTEMTQAEKGFDFNTALPWLIGGGIALTGLVLFAPRRKKAA